MADHADPIDTQQRRATRFVVVIAPGDGLERTTDQVLFLLHVLQHLVREAAEHHFGHPLAGLEQHIAHEALADNDVGPPLVQVAALDVAQVAVLDRAFEDQRVSLAGRVVPLALFTADVHEADARPGNAQHFPGVDVAHDGVLHEMLGLGAGVRPDIQQHHLPGHGGQHHANTRSTDAPQEETRPQASRDHRPGVPRADQCVNLPASHQFPADRDRAIGLFQQGLGRLFVHAGDPLRGHDFDLPTPVAHFGQGLV